MELLRTEEMPVRAEVNTLTKCVTVFSFMQ